MAPITDSVVDDLKSLVHRLESRIADLEAKVAGSDGTQSPSQSMRMILMGPPGAGMPLLIPFFAVSAAKL